MRWTGTLQLNVDDGRVIEAEAAGVLWLLGPDPPLDAGDGERPRGLEHAARLHEAVLDRRADVVGRDGDHVVHQLVADAERLSADRLDRGAVGKEACPQHAARPADSLSARMERASGAREQQQK